MALLTVADRTPRTQVMPGGASTGPFAFPWEFINLTDVLVYLGTSTVPLTYGVDYAVAGSAVGVGFSGGQVTLTVATALQVTMARQTAIQRLTNFPLVGPFDTSQLNRELDAMVMEVQEVRDRTNRSLVLPPTASVAVSSALPLPVANQFLAWDPTGLFLINAQAVAAGGVISAAMQPVVNAATIALGRTALGLGAAALEALAGNVVDDGAGNLATRETINPQAGAAYAIVAADRNKTITRSNAGAMADTLPNANTLPAGWSTTLKVLPASVGFVTITPAVSTMDGLAAIVVQPGRAVRIKSDGVNYVVEWLSERRDYIKLSHTVGSGVAGGGTTGGVFNQRVINTKDADPSNVLVGFNGVGGVSANQFSLPAGTYDFRYVAELYNGGRFRARLRNLTASATTLIGVGGLVTQSGVSNMSGRFTITVTSIFQIDEYLQSTEAVDGLGTPKSTGENEVFLIVEIWRL